jgi:ribosomal protein S18 acetylase RimI-like enzyme
MNDFKIRPATIEDAQGILNVAIPSFLSSHGKSAQKEDLDWFINQNYTIAAFEKDLIDTSCQYHVVIVQKEVVAYSKIALNTTFQEAKTQQLTKLDRFYVLPSFIGKGVSKALFEFLIDFSKGEKQEGIWLYTWTGNTRAISFYKKQGFEIVGAYDFSISPKHSNPNYRMLFHF